jgi:hypothetical protein
MFPRMNTAEANSQSPLPTKYNRAVAAMPSMAKKPKKRFFAPR